MKKYRLKIYPKGRGRTAYRVYEMRGDVNLSQLCSYILEMFRFDDDHMWEYCMTNKKYDRYGQTISASQAKRYTLDSMHLTETQKFSLHYDFGDDWMFVISVMKIEEADPRMKNRCIKEKGSVEQYPDFDGEW